MKKYNYYILILLGFMVLTACSGGNNEISLLPVKSGNLYQYIDKEGKIVINPQFEEAYPFYKGMALVQDASQKWGYIDEAGKYLIPATYKEATEFGNEDVAWVVSPNSPPTIINRKGEEVKAFKEFEEVKEFSEGIAAFRTSREIDTTAAISVGDDYIQKNAHNQDEKGMFWGFVNQEGDIIINQQYSEVSSFHEGKCAVKNSNGKWGFIDTKGKLLINYQFDNCHPGGFIEGNAIVSLENKWGVIDEEGKYLINPQFNDMFYDKDGLFGVELNGKWGSCDKTGKIVINPQFDMIGQFNGNELAPYWTKSVGMGYIDREGKIIINPQFDYATPFIGNLAAIIVAKKVGFIDKKGKYLINPQYDIQKTTNINRIFTGAKDSWLKSLNDTRTISSDFFDMESILNKINITNPEGFRINSKISEVLNRYKLSDKDFEAYVYQHKVLSHKRISKDAYYGFYVLGNFYKPSSNDIYSEDKFEPNAGVLGYIYELNLEGKGEGREDELISALEKKINGYTKRYVDGDKKNIIFTNDKQVIRIYKMGLSIYISIATYEMDNELHEREYSGESPEYSN